MSKEKLNQTQKFFNTVKVPLSEVLSDYVLLSSGLSMYEISTSYFKIERVSTVQERKPSHKTPRFT